MVDASPPPQKGGTGPQFWAHVCCGQTAGWVKMSLGTVVGLGRATLCQMWTHLQHSPHPKNIGPCLLWPNGWMDQDATWYEGRPVPRPHGVVWGRSSPFQRGHSLQFSASLLFPNSRPFQLLLTAENLFCVATVNRFIYIQLYFTITI